MKWNKKISLILPLVSIIIPSLVFAPKAIADSFGAEIFCTMRDSGNDHESSWKAAYSYIKKQTGGIFKTSPKQAAGQITESVVREKDKFSYCIEYLDQLHPNRKLQLENNKKDEKSQQEELIQEEESDNFSEELFQEEESNNFTEETLDRYSY
tara:strand:- start:22 stop:480 length:459 start_codon:yes stop_codon:yes gene_type:complete